MKSFQNTFGHHSGPIEAQHFVLKGNHCCRKASASLQLAGGAPTSQQGAAVHTSCSDAAKDEVC